MFLKTLHLRNFRNYIEQRVEFNAPKTILVGDNAQGKSNLLEAVGVLATLKSCRANRDRELIREGESVSQITAYLTRISGSVELSLTLRNSSRRTLAVNGYTLRRQLDFLGILKAVQFSSLDLDLVRGSPEVRRQWLDILLVQLEPIYAHILHQYNQVLRQRNALLKAIKTQKSIEGESFDIASKHSEIAIWDQQLASIGTRVIRRRARALVRLTPIAQEWHSAIARQGEILNIRYLPNVGSLLVSQLCDNPEQVECAFLEQIRQKALAEFHQGTTLVGPHRDEIEFTINQVPARQYGSQGQQRTLVLALKLAELKLIEEVVGDSPLLLLDDVLAELDPKRQHQLLEAIQERFQTLITTTNLGAFESSWLSKSQILSVKAGKIFSK
ncbi:MAG: DNA replication/repair protein RecF [Oscillatoriaceae bacterium SKW80]|nr:DNA replication/repair protein RecF [Oscillatoriaceae bacterium SKYG93]MCX8120371.1 DNA replication/repair protein RecF [Oscillatoriaceae bacterium SKW80]MDW8453297.1 DNA replication/repair protein RecF [Oscillatoriaceae cyanobacterium SKYGB_i_bin93]HIK27261.1 DNA replication/repair protein RecF [Oscillatoriaceae cyanobacterium M7585_C2015_266]